MCGKNQIRFGLVLEEVGSPPRVREKQESFYGALQGYGITPACAGKTAPCPLSRFKYRDHPRVCGKNLKNTSGLGCDKGSPPRVREKLDP